MDRPRSESGRLRGPRLNVVARPSVGSLGRRRQHCRDLLLRQNSILTSKVIIAATRLVDRRHRPIPSPRFSPAELAHAALRLLAQATARRVFRRNQASAVTWWNRCIWDGGLARRAQLLALGGDGNPPGPSIDTGTGRPTIWAMAR
jgi:hypothetical protein